jgi:hypothetical protein
MKEIYLPRSTVIEEKRISDNYKKRSRKWTFVLYLSVIGGIIFPIAGLFLGAMSYLCLFANAELFNRIGNLMIIAAFLMMMLGAHALDKISEIRLAEKRL